RFFRSRENKRNVHHQIMYDEFSTVYSNYLANNQTGVTRPTENTGKVITRWQRKSGFFLMSAITCLTIKHHERVLMSPWDNS
ncbi:hypothetical protein MLU10_007410, partial [Escherichia coli]|nr:hypothetical protein [Escherichia coli]